MRRREFITLLRRREFITLAGGAAATWPFAASAQADMPVVGFLNSLSPAETSYLVSAFRQGVAQAGLIERKTVRFDYLYADGVYERLPAMAAEFVRRKVAVIAAGAPPAAVAARAATSTIPIVFVVGFDPVTAGLVASYNRPGGNATGVCLITSPLAQKRLELIFELMPKSRNVSMLVNPTFPDRAIEIRDAQAAAAANGRQLRTVDAGTETEIDKAFESIHEEGADALIVASDPFFVTRREHLAALATRYRIAAIYPFREQVVAGGLMSYGPSLADAYRQAGVYAGRILRGEKPAELPVVQPATFEMVINLKTARAIGVDVPATLQARADEVIE
jgi:putative tryptophan/tyrosine transport system substrate-binding protein